MTPLYQNIEAAVAPFGVKRIEMPTPHELVIHLRLAYNTRVDVSAAMLSAVGAVCGGEASYALLLASPKGPYNTGTFPALRHHIEVQLPEGEQEHEPRPEEIDERLAADVTHSASVIGTYRSRFN